MPYPCWRCRHDDLAVAMIHLEGMTGSYDVITTDERPALAYAAELLSAGWSSAGREHQVTEEPDRERNLSVQRLHPLRCALRPVFHLGRLGGCRCEGRGELAADPGQCHPAGDRVARVGGSVSDQRQSYVATWVTANRPDWLATETSRHPAEAARSGCPRAPSGGTSMPGPPIGTPNEWHTSRSACPQRIPVHTTGGRTYQHTKREVLIGDPLPARLRRSRIRK